MVTSMTMQGIIDKQNETKDIYKNDFLLSYCIETFNDEIIPAIGRISTAFRIKDYDTKLISHVNYNEANRPLEDPYGKKYQENPTNRKGARPTYTELRQVF